MPGIQFSEDDNVLVQGVEGSPFAIGYFGYAYYIENTSRLRAVALEDVEPTVSAVDAGTYMLARPLFLYTDAGILAAKPQVAAFLNYTLTNIQDFVARVGYFQAPPRALRLAKLLLLIGEGDMM